MLVSKEAADIFNAMSEGILIIDTEERIVFGNTAYRRFLNQEAGADIGEIAGYYLRDLRPGAQLPRVLKTGKPILQALRKEIDSIYFVNMYPIYQNGKLEGGISVVTFMEEASAFRKMMNEMEDRNRELLRRVNKSISSRYTFDSIVACGEKSAECKRFAQRVAGSEAPVLLTSESGAGKEVYAQAIHNASSRSGRVFTAINCATFQKETLESELFGYVDGAFPGAQKGGKIGLFEAARGGTLFLDEISEMDLRTQSKLLRTLQEHTIRPVGGIEEIPVDVRLIAASNADLGAYITEGRFRGDLYYRLNTFHIHIPPLRERKEDIRELTDQILRDISTTLKKDVSITEKALERLMTHNWPGNIRELRNVLEFSAYLSPDGRITADSLPENIGSAAERDTTPLYQRVRRFERAEIQKALQHHGSDLRGKRAVAAELGISLAGLYGKLKEDS
ncbi:MAG: sigma 54-interacting transcriptional regulator [Clostridia bacterium]|nr:sigma 54-interacting transcriptional regulator [Clostridia bacterium]